MSFATGNNPRIYPGHLTFPTVNVVKINISLKDILLALMQLLVLTKTKEKSGQTCGLVGKKPRWKRREGTGTLILAVWLNYSPQESVQVGSQGHRQQ